MFGWKVTDYGADYTSFEYGKLSGGFYKGPPAPAGGPLVVIYSADLGATEKLVVRAGGVVTKREGFPGGKRFQFKDPVGNTLSVWKYS
ncbi:MAG TPA: hypothetical protein VI160_02550 [Gemmatimonadales bacterium]